MSWLARSIANSLKLEDDDDPPNPNLTDYNPQSDHHTQSSSPRGVKEDISELTKTLSRQFWGVASFLAPPPPESPPSSPPSQISDVTFDDPLLDRPPDPELSNEDLISGIRSDFAEIGGRFKSGISKLSSNAAVSEITKIASNFLQIGSERDFDDEDLVGSAIGVTEEVVLFARDIAMHPGTWLDFPVPDDFDEFDMSDAQQEHALAVERLAPRLAALRIELCPGYMSEGCFWKIYFVLLHPILSKEDAELLSTPQILEARTMLYHELKNQNKGTKSSEESLSLPSSENSESLKKPVFEVLPLTVSETTPVNEPLQIESEKHPIQSTEIEIVDKAVVEESSVSHDKNQNIPITSSSKVVEGKYDDTDDWLEEESSEMASTSGGAVHIENDEDVSFSDLEDDDDDVDVPTSYKKVTSVSDSSSKDSREWVELGKSSKQGGQVSAHNSDSKESNDWLDIEDIDVM